MQETKRTTISGLWTRRQFSLLVGAGLLGLRFTRAVHAGARSGSQPLLPRFPLTGPSPDRVEALLAYEPAQDPDAAYFRSFVIRQPTIPPFAPTQAQPRLSAQPQLASLTGCYRGLGPDADDAFKTQRYGTPPKDGVFISRMVGYHDILVSWSGPGIIPNPALTDAAHRNGALCLGTIFQPDHRIYDGSAAPRKTVAAKFVSLALYFGFDGYFVNFENGTAAQHRQVLDLIALMRDEAQRRGKLDFYIQFYDGSSDMNQLLPPRNAGAGMTTEGSFANSAMLDQGWSGYTMTRGCCSGTPVSPAAVAQYCKAHELEPGSAAFFGFQLYPGPGYLGLAAPSVIQPNGGFAYGGLQIYSWDDGLYDLAAFQAEDGAAQSSSPEEAFYWLERRFFSGQSGNPALDNAPTEAQARLYATTADGTRRYSEYAPGSTRSTDQIRLPITYGVANFIAERSVIATAPFVSHFNTGAGKAFFLAGKKVSDTAWFNMGIQDVLPTWQWWMEPKSGSFGGKAAHFAERKAADDAPLSISYSRDMAFDGGSCLRVQGRIPAGGGVALRLYKMKVALDTEVSSLQLVWHGAARLHGHLEIGMIFEDAPETIEWMPLSKPGVGKHKHAGGGWVRSMLSLGAYRGKTLAALLTGFEASGPADLPIDVRLGEIYLGASAGGARPRAPQGFVVEDHGRDERHGSVEARLRWTLDPQIAFYDLFAVTNRRQSWLGRISADRYYVSGALPDRDGSVTFHLVAVSRQAPLLRSKPAKVVVPALLGLGGGGEQG
ncbi:MAG: endo-beta-N-acetylglucosaminidase [Acidobacteriota bacterium]